MLSYMVHISFFVVMIRRPPISTRTDTLFPSTTLFRSEDLAEMYRLRYRVFKQRLDWDVEVSGDMELDAFDALHPAYLLQRAPDGHVRDRKSTRLNSSH